jgi:hypothetical protein
MMLRLISFVLLAAAAAYGLAAEGGRAKKGAVQAETRGDSLAVIVNRTNTVENLTFDELRQYFLGERSRWPGGRRVSLVMRDPTHPERAAVLRLIYDMRKQDFHTHFLRAKFTGEMLEEPRLLDSASRVVNFVFLQPGALGCVRAAEISPSVKVVRIDGLAPGDAGYKLAF